jgi:hypothetical protein
MKSQERTMKTADFELEIEIEALEAKIAPDDSLETILPL